MPLIFLHPQTLKLKLFELKKGAVRRSAMPNL